MKVRGITVVMVLAAIGAALMSGPLVAVSAARPAVKVEVGPDRFAPVDEETGEREAPYVFFALKGVKPGWMYRMVVEDSPKSTPSLPCNPSLTTQWHLAFGSGEVAFPTEPVSSGTYLPFAGNQPCDGGYVVEVQERRRSARAWSAVRAFAFTYPSFSFSYDPVSEADAGHQSRFRPQSTAYISPLLPPVPAAARAAALLSSRSEWAAVAITLPA